MSKHIKVVVIPVSLEVKPYVAEIDDDYRSYYPLIGCRTFDVVSLYSKDGKSVDAFVDDEGQINGSPVNEYWLRSYYLNKVHYPLYGISVITITDENSGESADMDLGLVREALLELGFIDSELGDVTD